MMQSQRTILWVVFSMSLLFLWDAWQKSEGKQSMIGGLFKTEVSQPPGPKPAPGKSDASVPTATAPAAGSVPGASASVAAVPGATSAAGAAVPGAAGAAPAAAATAVVSLANDVLKLSIDTGGGQVKRAELLKHRDLEKKDANVVLLEEVTGSTYLAQSGFIGAPVAAAGVPAEAQSFPTHRTTYTLAQDPKTEGDTTTMKLTAESGGLKILRTYTLTKGSYLVTFKDELTNTGAAALKPIQYLQLVRDSNKPPGESQFYSTFTGPVIYTDEKKFEKIDFKDIEKQKNDLHNKASSEGWVGMIQHYFVSAWVPEGKVAREFYTRKVDTNLFAVGFKQPLADLAPGASSATTAKLYIGPQDQSILEKVAPGLDLTVDYGWLTPVAKPIYWLLGYLHTLVLNWGWAIVLLTIVIKTIFFPLQAASYRSMARMKAVTPRMTAIRERYGSDRVKMNQAMMELYKTEKINPIGGCLPIVVQIPVFIALYWVLLASVEMRNAPWIGWIKDLAAPDPFYLLPLIMAGTMFIQVKLNPTPPDPVQAKVMMFMPLIFSVMFFFFPAGLVLYWLVNNLYSIAQQWVITRKMEGKPIFGRAPAVKA
jgi:YidC/Oxa1 family membrane protein insertase